MKLPDNDVPYIKEQWKKQMSGMNERFQWILSFVLILSQRWMRGHIFHIFKSSNHHIVRLGIYKVEVAQQDHNMSRIHPMGSTHHINNVRNIILQKDQDVSVSLYSWTPSPKIPVNDSCIWHNMKTLWLSHSPGRPRDQLIPALLSSFVCLFTFH